MSATRPARSRFVDSSLGLCGCTTALALIAGCFATPIPSGAPAVSTAANESRESNSRALDLDPVGNAKLAEYEGIPTGAQRLGGVDFRVGDSAIRVGSRPYPEFPSRVSGVIVGRTFRVAHFLHATNGGAFQQPGHPKHELDGVLIGEYVIRYDDGSAEKIPVRYGQEARDFWNWDRSLPTTDSEVVWNGENPEAAKYGMKVRLFKASWLNPHPEKQVATIDLVSANATAAPVCFAITVDDDPTYSPPAKTVTEGLTSAAQAPDRPIEAAAAPREADSPSQPSTPLEPASSQLTSGPTVTQDIEATPNEPPASPVVIEKPKEAERPVSSDDPPSAGSKPAFDLFGAGEDVSESTVGEEAEPPDFLGPAPERWEVVVDPPVALPTYQDTLPYERLDGIRSRRVFAPATPSPFLAIEEGNVDVEGFRVLDLRSGEQVASVDGMNHYKGVHLAFGPAISPDGRLIAMYDFDSRSIYVGDVFKRKTQNRFSWSDSDPILYFAKPDVLIAIAPEDNSRVEVLQLPLGAQIASIVLDDRPESEPGLFAVSPGGRFLALALTGNPPEIATFYDLKSGKEVGKLGRRGSAVNAYFMAFAFSPDGTEFAGYMNALGNDSGDEGVHHGMVVWDVKTGRRIYEAPYEYGGGFDAAHAASRRPLQWFPDRQGWLLSQVHVFGRKERRVVRSLTEHMHAGLEPTGAQVLDDRRLLISDATTAGMEIVEDVRSAAAEPER